MNDPWKRKEVIGDCTLYLGDAMEILPTLEPVDLVFSDVPYKLTTGGKSKSSKTMSGKFAAHNYANDGQLVMAVVPFDEMLSALYGALKDDADCYIMSNDKNIHPILNAAIDAGFKLHNILPWHKVTATANRWYMKDCEFTLYFWKGAAKTINNPGTKQLIRGGTLAATGHPTEKPVSLVRIYIENSSQPGDVVLDPFMGSGSTGVACIRSGRRFVGLELDPEYFDIACGEMRKALEMPELIALPPMQLEGVA